MGGLSWEAIIAIFSLILGAILSGFGGIYAILLRHGVTLGKIDAKLTALESRDNQNREDHTRLWTRIDDHEKRISRLEK